MHSLLRRKPTGPSPRPDATQRREDINLALQGTNDILTLLQKLSDGGIPCDPLKATLGAAIELVKWVQEARANEKDSKALAQQTYDYMHLILSHVPNTGDLPQTLEKDIKKVQSDLEEVCKGLQALPQKRNIIKDIIARVQIAEAIKGFKAKLEQSKQDFLVVGAIEVRIELARIQQGKTENSTIPSSSFQFSATLPPPPPYLFGREHLLDQAITCLTVSSSLIHVAILGTGGIGKTTLAVAILHHPKIQEIYGNFRYSVPCDSLSTSEALVFALLKILDVSFDAKDPLTALLTCLRASKHMLLLLDNFESPWMSAGQQTRLTDILNHLADTGANLMVTMRGDSPPALGTVQWSSLKPEVLSPTDAHALFISINPQTSEAEYEDLKLLLNEVDHLPLAIKLLAVLKGSNTCSRLLTQWRRKRTAFLDIEEGSGDHLTSLNISISLSLDSKVIASVPEAVQLLYLLTHLPDGVQGGIDQLEKMELGFNDIDKALATLCKVALVTLDGQGSIKVLAPTRHHVLSREQVNTNLGALYNWYSQLVKHHAHLKPGQLGFLNAQRLLSPEMGNITSLMKMALERNTWSTTLTQAGMSLARFQSWDIPSTEIIDLVLTYHEMSQIPIQAAQLFRKARLLERTNKYADATRLYMRAKVDYTAEQNKLGTAWCLWSLGNICMMQDKYSEATTNVEQALSEFQTIGSRMGAAQCLQTLGNICEMQDQYSEATTKLEQALSEFRGCENRMGAAQCLQGLGDICRMQSQYSEATTKLEQALTEFQALGDRRGAAQCLQNLGYISMTKKQYDEAITKLEWALSEFQTIGSRMGAAQCLQSLGDICRMQKQYSEATPKLEQALSEFQMIGSQMGATQCLQSLGDICRMQKQYSEATTKLEQALSKFQGIGDRMGAAHCLQSLGDIYRMQKQYSEATPKLEWALSEFQVLGNRMGAAQCLQSLGNICRTQDQYGEAMAKLEQALSEFQAIEDRMGAAQCLQSLGNICRTQKQYSEATPKLEWALSEFQVLGNSMGAAHCLRSLGNIYMMQNQYSEATTKLEHAVSEFQTIGSILDVSDTLQILSQLSSSIGHHDKALELLQQALPHAESCGSAYELAWCYRYMAQSLVELHQLQKALEAINAAKLLFAQIESHRQEVQDCDKCILKWTELIEQAEESV